MARNWENPLIQKEINKTFNQRVPGSSPGGRTNKISVLVDFRAGRQAVVSVLCLYDAPKQRRPHPCYRHDGCRRETLRSLFQSARAGRGENRPRACWHLSRGSKPGSRTGQELALVGRRYRGGQRRARIGRRVARRGACGTRVRLSPARVRSRRRPGRRPRSRARWVRAPHHPSLENRSGGTRRGPLRRGVDHAPHRGMARRRRPR